MYNDLLKQTNLLKILARNPQNVKEQNDLICNGQIWLVYIDPKSSKAFIIEPKNESVVATSCSKILKSNEWNVRWQDQERWGKNSVA